MFSVPSFDTSNVLFKLQTKTWLSFNFSLEAGSQAPDTVGTFGPFVFDAVQMFGAALAQQVLCNAAKATGGKVSEVCKTLPVPVTAALLPDGSVPVIADLVPYLHASKFMGSSGPVFFQAGSFNRALDAAQPLLAHRVICSLVHFALLSRFVYGVQ